MTDTELTDRAERIGRKRARMLPILPVLLLAQQGSYFSSTESGRTVDHVHLAAWIIMTLAVLLLLSTNGFWNYRRDLRKLLDDEVTRDHRARAMATGFVSAMLSGIVLFAMKGALEFTAAEAIHLIVSAGLIAALLRFAWLERRAYA